jgi:hypothetical protein
MTDIDTDLFGFKLRQKHVVTDTLVCIKCNTEQPIEQFNKMKYKNENKDKPTEIKRTCRTCMRNQSNLVAQLRRENPKPDEHYKCPICDRGIEEIGKYNQPRLQNWVLDHCHDTGTFRGWLCHHCNVGLGGFKDNLTRLKKAVEYMTKHKETVNEDSN